MKKIRRVVWRLKLDTEPAFVFSDVPMGGVFRKLKGGCVYMKTTGFTLNNEVVNCVILGSENPSYDVGCYYRTEPDKEVFNTTVEITA